MGNVVYKYKPIYRNTPENRNQLKKFCSIFQNIF